MRAASQTDLTASVSSLSAPVPAGDEIPINVTTASDQRAPSVAMGADALLIEVHPDPDHAVSDGAQSLTFPAFEKLLESLKRLAEPLNRTLN